MGWQEDLGLLLEETSAGAGEGVANFFASPVGQPIAGALTSGPAEAAFGVLDLPFKGVREAYGQAVNVAEGHGLQAPGAGQTRWDQAVQELRQGPGGLAKMPLELAVDVVADPANWIGAGAARDLAATARVGANLATISDRPLAAAALRATERGAKGAEFIYGEGIGKLAKERVVQPAFRGIKRGIEKVSPTAFDTAPDFVIRQGDDDVTNWLSEESAAKNGAPPQRGLPQIQPISASNAPPVAPHPHPGGSAAAGAYRIGVTGWQRLRDKYFNGSLGITPNGPAPRAQWLTPRDVNLTEDDVADMAAVGVSVMQGITDAGGLMPALSRASTGAEQFRSQVVGQYGQGIEPYLPAVYQRMRQDLLAQGQDPDLILPSSRFLLPHGWAQGTVKTARLDSVNKAHRANNTTREQALAALQAKTSKGSPEVVEAAAAMGAGFASLFRSGPDETYKAFLPGGLYFPEGGGDVPNALGVVPKEQFAQEVWSGQGPAGLGIDLSQAGKVFGVTQPFGSNREAWNAYMRHEFGGLHDDELDSLADTSIDFLYDLYVNAANEFSGGRQGAAALGGALNAEGTAIDSELLRSVSKKGERTSIPEERRKIGAYAREAADIGSPESQQLLRSLDQPGSSAIRYNKHGQANEVDLWQAQADQLAGHPVTPGEIIEVLPRYRGKKKNTGPMLQDYIQHLGHSPIRKNPLGGPVPTLTQIVERWHDSLDLPVGITVASDWYPRAAKEIESIVGRGNYEDALVLLNAIGVTSTATEVSRNAELALRVLAEWKFGKDDTLKSALGMTGKEFNDVLQSGALRTDFLDNQSKATEKMFNEFVRRREEPNTLPQALQGGPKTHNYAGSFLVNLWRPQMELARDAMAKLGNSKLAQDAKRSFEEALSIYTVDRHDSRISNLGTAVSPIESFLLRERGILAARHLGISGEALQAAGWYWVRDRQGFMREIRADSDITVALRKAIEETWNRGATRLSPKAEAGGVSTSDSWNDVISRLMTEKGLTQDQAWDEAYDLTKQDIFYRLIGKSLADPKVQEALAKAGLPHDLEAMHGDAMGLMARGAHGLYPAEWPAPLHQADSLRQAFEAVLPASDTVPQALGFRGGQWVPVNQGYAVPILDAGRVGVRTPQTARKALERTITKGTVSDLFDPVTTAGNEDVLGFVLVPESAGKARLAVATFLPDRSAAEDAAAKAGADQVLDLATGAGISIPGGKGELGFAGRDLHRIMQDIHGPYESRPKLALEDVRKRGITMAEQDMFNPFSLWNRKVANPIMDAMSELGLRGAVHDLTGTDPGDLGVPEWPEVAADSLAQKGGTGFRPDISLNANNVANTKLKDGRTYRAFVDTESLRAKRDMDTLAQSGAKWDAFTGLNERLKVIQALPGVTPGAKAELEKLVRAWHKDGIDLMHADNPQDVAKELLSRQRRSDAGMKNQRSTIGALLMSAWGEQVLATPRYLTGNWQENVIRNALAGTIGGQSPAEVWRWFKVYRAGADTITRDEAIESLKSTQVLRGWGVDKPPAELFRGGIRAMTSNEARSSPSAIGELVGRATRNPTLGHKAGWIFIANNDMAQGMDSAARSARYADVFDAEMRRMMPSWEAEVRRRGQGIDGFEFSVLGNVNPVKGGLRAGAIKAHLMDMGLQDGVAEHLQRQYLNLKSEGMRLAKQDLDRVQFSFDRTNLDEWIGRFVPFHYWYSRAIRFYGEEVLDHPYLLLNYMRANEGIEAAQEDPGLSARQKGFLRLFSTGLGFSLLMNPDALFGVVKIFGMNDDYDPDGQTAMGGGIAWLKARGLGLYPWLDGTLNLMGLYGNDFEPDLLGIRHKALVGAAINFARAHAGFDPASAPYADAMGQVRYGVSSFVSSFTPDWLAQPVTPRPGGSSQEATLDTVVESIVLQNNPQLTNDQLLTIMTNPEDPAYQQAFQQAADAGIVQQLLNFTIPENVRMRADSRDVRTAQVQLIEEKARQAGVPPWKLSPTMDDLDWLAKYKRLTGSDFKEGDYEGAKFKHDLERAPVEAKRFLVSEADYHSLGNDRQQRIMERYQAIRDGTDPDTVGMDETQRALAADTWANRTGADKAIAKVRDQQDAFRQSHPEFDEFKLWQGQMYSLRTQWGGSLAEYRRRASEQNPNAKRYFDDQYQWILSNNPGITPEDLAAKLDDATVGAGAWQAITGKGTLRSVQGPIPGVPPVDVTMPGMVAEQVNLGGYGSGGVDWTSALQQEARAAGATLR